jgi:hypothetical protein
MPLSILSGWREERSRDSRARGYVESLMAPPDGERVKKLAAISDGDVDHALWELRYAMRAIGILVAERDALDDRTSSDVVAVLGVALESDPHVAPDRRAIAERQLNDRLRGYRAALADRGAAGGTSARLGRVLLSFARSTTPDDAAVAFAADVVASMIAACNGALRTAYGEVNLPPDVVPSALRKRPQ